MLSKVIQRNFASKIMAGSTNNKKDSAGRRLGIKRWGKAEVRKGDIIAKQRGYKWHPGNNVHSGNDHTIHASVEGVVVWSKDRYAYKKRSRIHVIPQETPNRQFPSPAPFAYHPELYPELAEMNPTPYEFLIPRSSKKRTRSPRSLGCSVVANPSLEETGYLDVSKLIDSERFAQHRGFAYEKQDPALLEDF